MSISEHRLKHPLKHHCCILGLSTGFQLLPCPEVLPLITDMMLMLSEVLQTFFIVFTAYKYDLTKRRILHDAAHQQQPFTVVQFFLI